MGNLKKELVEATKTFELVKILNESIEAKSIDDIAKELGTTKQNIYRALQNGMDKLYKQMKKDNKCSPAQAIKILMNYWNADAEEILGYLGKDARAEVDNYVRQHGAN